MSLLEFVQRCRKGILMAKKIIEATKLENATVGFISLVERGANRIPFRIMKSDNQESGMIDLGKILKMDGKKTKKEETPTVVGLVVEKSDNFEEVKAAIVASGFSVDTAVENEDGTVIFKQEEYDLDKCLVVKMSDELVVVMKGFQPWATDGLSFTETVKSVGFFPSVSIAMDALRDTMYGVLVEAPDGGGPEVIAKMESVLKEFSSYVIDQAKNIPSAVFKCDKALKSMDKKKKMTDEEIAAMEAAKEKAKKEEEAAQEAAAAKVADPVVTEPAKTEPSPEAVLKAGLDTALAPMLTSIQSITDSLAGLSTKVAEISTAQSTLTTKLEKVEEVAKSASDAVKTNIIGGLPAGDEGLSKQVVKGESSGKCIDTAFDRVQKRGTRTAH
jgi:hypothetical protein